MYVVSYLVTRNVSVAFIYALYLQPFQGPPPGQGPPRGPPPGSIPPDPRGPPPRPDWNRPPGPGTVLVIVLYLKREVRSEFCSSSANPKTLFYNNLLLSFNLWFNEDQIATAVEDRGALNLRYRNMHPVRCEELKTVRCTDVRAKGFKFWNRQFTVQVWWKSRPWIWHVILQSFGLGD
jgi:hypothetical protein